MITPLGNTHASALRQLLLTDEVTNLFLLGFLDAHGIGGGTWVGSLSRTLEACALVIPGRLVVPFSPDTSHAFRLGAFLRGRYRPSMLVGPRDASDALWDGWTQGDVKPLRFYDQRLYVVDTPRMGPPVEGFRRATPRDTAIVAAHAAAMEMEDLGRDPRDESPAQHERVVRDRIDRGRTYVIERAGRMIFQVNVGTISEFGCQIGGTFVPPEDRGRGYAKAGVRAVVRELLTEHVRVTLHVNEANTPAVAAYEQVGFQRASPFRLLTL